MGPVGELSPLLSYQFEECLVDQRGCLKSLTGFLVAQFGSGQPAQFLINQRKKFVRGGGIPLLDRIQNPSGIAHRHP